MSWRYALAYGDKAELFSGATNRPAVRKVVAAGMVDVAIVVEVQEISAIANRCTRPIAAVATHNDEGATVVVEIARSRIPALITRCEISLEVHSIVY